MGSKSGSRYKNNEDLFGYIPCDKHENLKLLKAINQYLNRNYEYNEVFIVPRKKILQHNGIEAFKNILIEKYNSIKISSFVYNGNNSKVFENIINKMETESYLLCTSGLHSNLITRQKINGEDYYFIFDSMGWKQKSIINFANGIGCVPKI